MEKEQATNNCTIHHDCKGKSFASGEVIKGFATTKYSLSCASAGVDLHFGTFFFRSIRNIFFMMELLNCFGLYHRGDGEKTFEYNQIVVIFWVIS